MEMIYSNTEPGDLVRFVTPDSQNANITLYLADHKGETLRKVVAHAREFIDKNPMEKANFRLASGYGGLLAAINEEVAYHQGTVTVLAFIIIVAFCGAAYKSGWAGLLFLLPLVISNYLTYALMGARGIGLDVNALPVVSLGVGLGVDYGLYVVGRIKEEYQILLDLKQAVIRGVSTAGKAVAFTAITMIAGVAFWTTSFLRFQAEMGMLLVFWMVISMLGGLILLPTLIAIFKPRFITKID
jgi:predicted RND superfamily exporter protein